MSIKNIEDLKDAPALDILIAWGRWARADGHGLGVKSPAAQLILTAHGNTNSGSGRPALGIDDLSAAVVENAIAKLTKKHEELGAVLWLVYFKQLKSAAMAKALGERRGEAVSRYMALQVLAKAEGYFEGYLDAELERAFNQREFENK